VEPHVLLIEDDVNLGKVVAGAVASRGFDVALATTGEDGLRQASVRVPDIVVLDLGLPDIDGLEVCERLKRWYRNPVVVLSADGAEDRKVAALDLGADDYVTKTFSMPELLARLRVALRHRAVVADDEVIRLGDLVIDTGSRLVTAGGADVVLTPKEHALLEVLARNAGKVLTHGALETATGTTGLRYQVNQLRSKLGTGQHRPVLLTEPGVGYRLALPEVLSG
jgi:two-component system KDP operon response regulator KdpE